MKRIALLLGLVSTVIFAHVKSINPKYRLHDLYDLFNDYNSVGKKVSVKTFSYRKGGFNSGYFHKKDGAKIDLGEFQMMQDLGQRVFRTHASDHENAQGSSFYVGGRLVLTNYHVYSPDYRSYKMGCGNFAITTNSSLEGVKLYCEEVIRCNKELDYCLIKIKDKVKKKFLSSEVIKRWSLTSLEPLPIASKQVLGPKVITRAIGNPQFEGIHASKGIGASRYKSRILFYAPVFGGNSGGPLLNEAGEVFGVVKSQSPDLLSDQSYNFAIPINLIWNDLKENVSLDKIKNFRY
jgi:hypothetical protein